MMRKETFTRKLEKMISIDIDHLLNNSIIPQGKGYSVFNRYQLNPTESEVTLYVDSIMDQLTFGSKRTALGWCVADKYQKSNLAREIAYLDRQKVRLQDDVAAQIKSLKNFKDPIRRSIVEVKLDNKKVALKQVSDKLNKCINTAKYWQIKGFNDEIERTRKTNPFRSTSKNH